MPELCSCGCSDIRYPSPAEPRVWAFFDAQNLFRTAGRCFNDADVPYLNFDPIALATWATSRIPNAHLVGVTFYTGVPDGRIDAGEADLEDFWKAKLSYYGGKYPSLFRASTRSVRYNYLRKFIRGREVLLPKAEEKGIDVRIALDVVLGALWNAYDVGVLFSQDKDLNEPTKRIWQMRRDRNLARWVHLECLYPVPDTKTIISRRGNQKLDRHGISHTRWSALTREVYRQCLDKKDFRRTYSSNETLKFAGNFESRHVENDACKHLERTRLLMDKPCPVCTVCGASTVWRRYKQFR
jgi:hypothetical protein